MNLKEIANSQVITVNSADPIDKAIALMQNHFPGLSIF